MNHSDFKELKQLALSVELARPLAHECNNFLNNLLLQLAISEKSFPESSRTEWANIRREGRKLADLFQQWQRQNKNRTEDRARFELTQVIEHLVDELRSDWPAIVFLVRRSTAPLLFNGRQSDVQSLFSLLLRYAASGLRMNGSDSSTIELQLDSSGDRIQVRLLHAGADWKDFDEIASFERTSLSLPALACKSLVERLEGTATLTSDPNEGKMLVIDLPLAAS